MSLHTDLLYAQERAEALERLRRIKVQLAKGLPAAPIALQPLLAQAADLEQRGVRNPLHRLLGDDDRTITDTFLDSPNRLREE